MKTGEEENGRQFERNANSVVPVYRRLPYVWEMSISQCVSQGLVPLPVVNSDRKLH